MTDQKSYEELNYSTADEFWEAIRPEKIGTLINPDQYPIYRGQADSEWQLAPSVSRNVVNKTIFGQALREIELISTFLEYCDKNGIQVPGYHPITLKYLQHCSNPFQREEQAQWPQPEVYEILAFAQHFDVPTRLLDWSYRSFVAAYFATAKAVAMIALDIQNDRKPDFGKKIALWILGTKSLISPSITMTRNGWNQPLNLIRIPSGVNHHIGAQQGCFTLFRDVSTFSSDPEDLLSPPIFEPSRTIDSSGYFINDLTKLTLPYDEAHKLLDLCDLYNANAASLFPSAYGSALASKDKINSRVVHEYLNGLSILRNK